MMLRAQSKLPAAYSVAPPGVLGGEPPALTASINALMVRSERTGRAIKNSFNREPFQTGSRQTRVMSYVAPFLLTETQHNQKR
jgi:hypothetical protein